METSPEQTIEIAEQRRYAMDNYPLLLLLTVLTAGLLVVSLGLNVLLRRAAVPPPVIFPATKVSQLIQEAPLDEPGIETTVLLNWVAQSMMAAHTFNFINYNSARQCRIIMLQPSGRFNKKSFIRPVKKLCR